MPRPIHICLTTELKSHWTVPLRLYFSFYHTHTIILFEHERSPSCYWLLIRFYQTGTFVTLSDDDILPFVLPLVFFSISLLFSATHWVSKTEKLVSILLSPTSRSIKFVVFIMTKHLLFRIARAEYSRGRRC
jgi:hypothetical protein